MGAIPIECGGYYPLSDEMVVRALIEQRGKLLDAAVRSFDEDLICLYIDLDRLIQEVSSTLPTSEAYTLGKYLEGYTAADICAGDGASRQAYNGYYARAVKKITAEAKRQWALCHGDAPAKENPRFCV